MANEISSVDSAPLQVMPPRQQFSLAPRDLTEAMKFAEMMASSELVPKQFRNKPGDVLIAVQMGAEVGLAAMAAIQNIAVINGKPGIYGDAGKAILLANGCIIEEDDIEVIKQTGRACCTITRKGRPPVTRTFSIEDAKTANLWNKEGPWRSYPFRQMAWRAFWFAARDAASDMLKGLGGAEELADIVEKDITARSDPSLAAKWIDKANCAKDSDELSQVWKSGLAEIKAAADMPAYQAFKAAVEAKGKALKSKPASDDFSASYDAALAREKTASEAAPQPDDYVPE